MARAVVPGTAATTFAAGDNSVEVFGTKGTAVLSGVDLASPATPEAVWWALERVRAGGDDRLVVGGSDATGVEPPQTDGPAYRPSSERLAQDQVQS